MLAVKALLVNFDGTACLQDVSELLLDAFGEPGWEAYRRRRQHRRDGTARSRMTIELPTV